MGITGTDGLLTTMAIMERGQPMLSQQQLLRLMPSPGGTDLTGMAGPLTATATTEKGLQTLNQLTGGNDTTETIPFLSFRNDELHQAKQSWTVAKPKNSAERNQYR